MGPRHFVSRATGHPLVAGFEPDDFSFWHDAKAGFATPLLLTVLEAAGWDPILQSGNGSWQGTWQAAPAAVEKPHGKGSWRICQVKLDRRTRTNPAARIFAARLLGLEN